MTVFEPQLLAGSVALITGAASGIGRATALLFAKHGAKVALADRDAAGTEAVRASIVASGGTATAIAVEIGDRASVESMVETAVRSFGQLDVLVHCAATLKIESVMDLTDEDWHRVIGVNLDGTFYVSRAAARVMAPRKTGRIILATSGLGIVGMKRNAAYASSKGGVNAFMFSLAREVQPLGILVNAVNPGQTETPLMRLLPEELLTTATETDRALGVGRPENVAETILFLATNTAAITGQIVNVRMLG